VLLADAPAPQITSLTVTIDRVEAGIDGVWTPIATTPQRFDLLDLVKNEAILASTVLPAGHYTQIRLFPSSATVTDATGPHSVQMPSAAQTGLKLNVDYDIGPNQVTSILLDFNVNRSLVRQGNGQYSLKPVIPAVVALRSGTVTGSVTDGSGPIPGATIAAIYTAGDRYPIGTEVNSAVSVADGTYKVWALLPGAYRIEAGYIDASTGSATSGMKEDVVVTAGANTDAGTITVQ
jgi:hypothetical protein